MARDVAGGGAARDVLCVDHILLCPPERASLAPPPPATFLAKVEKSKNSKVLKDFLWRHENVKKKNTMVLECFGNHNLVTT